MLFASYVSLLHFYLLLLISRKLFSLFLASLLSQRFQVLFLFYYNQFDVHLLAILFVVFLNYFCFKEWFLSSSSQDIWRVIPKFRRYNFFWGVKYQIVSMNFLWRVVAYGHLRVRLLGYCLEEILFLCPLSLLTELTERFSKVPWTIGSFCIFIDYFVSIW